MNTISARWYAQNEATDEFFCLLQGEAAFEPEREALRAMGAPEVDGIVFHDIVPEDRDNAEVTADVPQAFRDWLASDEIDMLLD